MKDILKTDQEKKALTLTRRGKLALAAGIPAVLGAGAVIGVDIANTHDTVSHTPVVLNDNSSPQPSNDKLMQDIQRHRQQMDNNIQVINQYDSQK